MFGSNNTIWEKSFGGITVRLKATNSDRWLVELDKTGKLRYVQYVHQLQDMWRGLFDEPLQRRVGDIKVEVPVLKLRPEYQVSVVSEKKKEVCVSLCNVCLSAAAILPDLGLFVRGMHDAPGSMEGGGR
ncbi:hypothetical protein MKQ70_04405 [Chitinophaga sedimenti]|uniref:hypothetical protein n=1 Tax=Chitinophaga sedimenti TaxID=2033606 RepID=UPI002006084A|nr:hypothetical protein [Chitinophaga sedimenti]MCK7554292.1 hypothetical protein [Chitinophaga sedimenti]